MQRSNFLFLFEVFSFLFKEVNLSELKFSFISTVFVPVKSSLWRLKICFKEGFFFPCENSFSVRLKILFI